MTEPIMTTDELDAYLSGEPQRMLAAATAALRAYCGWHVAPVIEETVAVRLEGGLALLPSLRVVSVSSVKADGQVLDADAYEWEPSGILHAHRGTCRVEVAMRHGFPADEVADIVGVIASMVRRGQSNPMGADVLKAVEYSAQYGADASAGAGGLTAHQMAILDRYKLPLRP